MADNDQTRQERKLAEAHAIKSEQVSIRFSRQIHLAKRDWDKMLDFTMKFSITQDQRKAYMDNIQQFKRQGKLPYEIIAKGEDPQAERPRTWADDWELWIRNQYAMKISECTSISEVGGMMLEDTRGDFRRSLWHPSVFIRGIRGGISAIIEGDPGTGKTMFACQELIEPASKIPNLQIVSNIAIKSFSGGPVPDNVKYASNVPRALRLAIEHSLAGIQARAQAELDGDPDKLAELDRFPHLTLWFIDEAGISRDKHDAMSDQWKTLRHITMISRKLKIMQFVIYQFDDAPDDLRKLAHHQFRKPDLHHLDYVKFSIRTICPEITLTGVLDDRGRAAIGMPYVEYDTDDTAGMAMDEFDTQAMLDYVNAIAKDGAIGSEGQFKRCLEYIAMIENRSFSISTKEGDMFFLYRVKRYCEAEAERLQREAKAAKTKKHKEQLESDAKVMKSYTRWPFLCRMAKARYPDRNFYAESTLQREFKKLEKKFPQIMDMEAYPDVETVGTSEAARPDTAEA
jgi:hypothetical protein